MLGNLSVGSKPEIGLRFGSADQFFARSSQMMVVSSMGASYLRVMQYGKVGTLDAVEGAIPTDAMGAALSRLLAIIDERWARNWHIPMPIAGASLSALGAP